MQSSFPTLIGMPTALVHIFYDNLLSSLWHYYLILWCTFIQLSVFVTTILPLVYPSAIQFKKEYNILILMFDQFLFRRCWSAASIVKFFASFSYRIFWSTLLLVLIEVTFHFLPVIYEICNFRRTLFCYGEAIMTI